MGDAAVAAAASIGYIGVGRHPVTEMISSVDLIEEQICVAVGEKLFMTQVDVLENIRPEVVEDTREVENNFLGARVLIDLHELKFGVVTLHSCKKFDYFLV
ncbi:unnamed protein product [Lactuca virosa]|uniref:Uncharacterized protein n=1 Tax=Lactuca virosa TaxID=75947 RepID=A0AAU9PLS5_9ASTR|nr:unnamed protein product [Lactuca virosa]